MLALAGCTATGNPSAGASSASPVPGLRLRLVAPAHAGVPTRAIGTITPAKDGAPVSVVDEAGATLDTATTDVAGRAFLSWTWPEAGIHRVSAREDAGRGSFRLRSTDVDIDLGDGSPKGSPSAQGTRTDDDSRLVEGGGQSMWLDCRGAGAPTIVLIAGLDGWSKDWDPMVDTLRTRARVCTYDRPGLGRSPGRSGALDVDASVHAAELAEGLATAGETGPFLVVGHSYGGLVARAFNDAFPEATAGMVLLDPVPAYFHHAYPAYDSTFIEAQPQTTIDLERSGDATGGAAPLAGLPLIVLAAGAPQSWTTPEEWRLWQEAQQETAAASSNGLYLVAAGATHQLQSTATDLSVAAVEEVLASLREHRRVEVSPALSAAADQ